MKIDLNQEWLTKRAEQEEGADVSAGQAMSEPTNQDAEMARKAMIEKFQPTLSAKEIGRIFDAGYAAAKSEAPDERIYPCAKCGTMRSKAEGGTVFTVCDDCWDEKYGSESEAPAPDEMHIDDTRSVNGDMEPKSLVEAIRGAATALDGQWSKSWIKTLLEAATELEQWQKVGELIEGDGEVVLGSRYECKDGWWGADDLPNGAPLSTTFLDAFITRDRIPHQDFDEI